MVKNGERYHIEGVLSFVKGCDRFAMGADEEKEKFVFTSPWLTVSYLVTCPGWQDNLASLMTTTLLR